MSRYSPSSAASPSWPALLRRTSRRPRIENFADRLAALGKGASEAAKVCRAADAAGFDRRRPARPTASHRMSCGRVRVDVVRRSFGSGLTRRSRAWARWRQGRTCSRSRVRMRSWPRSLPSSQRPSRPNTAQAALARQLARRSAWPGQVPNEELGDTGLRFAVRPGLLASCGAAYLFWPVACRLGTSHVRRAPRPTAGSRKESLHATFVRHSGCPHGSRQDRRRWLARLAARSACFGGIGERRVVPERLGWRASVRADGRAFPGSPEPKVPMGSEQGAAWWRRIISSTSSRLTPMTWPILTADSAPLLIHCG